MRSMPTITAPLPGKPTLVRFPQHPLSCALSPFPEPGEAFLLSSSPPPCPQHPAGPRGGFSESATVSAESLAVWANGRSFFNQLKWHFLQISLPLSAAKKKPVGQQQGKKKNQTNPNTTPPTHRGCKVTAQARRVIIYSPSLCKSQK